MHKLSIYSDLNEELHVVRTLTGSLIRIGPVNSPAHSSFIAVTFQTCPYNSTILSFKSYL